MEELNVKSIDRLIKGIKHLLSQSRCSFSEDEKALLNDCLRALEKLNQLVQQQKIWDVNTAIKIVELLLRVFVISGHIRDIH